MVPLNLGMRGHDLNFSTKEELAEKLHSYHLRHLQLAVKKTFPELVPDLSKITFGTASYLGDYLQNQNLKISILGCYVDLSSNDPSIHKNAMASFNRHLEVANTFHASLVGTEMGAYKPTLEDRHPLKTLTKNVYGSLEEMLETASKCGATVGLEAGTNHPFSNLSSLKKIIKDFSSPNLKIIFDPVNLLTKENALKQKEITYDFLDSLQGHIAAIHLKDFILEDKLKIVPVGHGQMDFSDIFHFIKSSAPLLPVSMENVKEPDLPHSIQFLQDKFEA